MFISPKREILHHVTTAVCNIWEPETIKFLECVFLSISYRWFCSDSENCLFQLYNFNLFNSLRRTFYTIGVQKTSVSRRPPELRCHRRELEPLLTTLHLTPELFIRILFHLQNYFFFLKYFFFSKFEKKFLNIFFFLSSNYFFFWKFPLEVNFFSEFQHLSQISDFSLNS